jgi:hypothetical protein
MNLFCFASKDTRNIELGIEHQMWAVATLANQAAMAARVTKACRYLHVGARGVLYCNPLQSFTTPFIVQPRVDPVKVVTDVWPQPWRLPFKIKTLGNLSRCLHKDDAPKHWPTLGIRIGERHGRGGISAAFNITGTTVFVPVEIEDVDWNAILEDLAC